MWPQTFKRYRRKGWLRGAKKKCPYCGVILSARTATVDHIVPKSKGGTNRRENKQLACRRCNAAKGSRPRSEGIHWEAAETSRWDDFWNE